jgi:hypothetical protein
LTCARLSWGISSKAEALRRSTGFRPRGSPHDIEFLIDEVDKPTPAAAAIGLKGGEMEFTSLYDFPRLVEPGFQRPKDQWWLRLRPIATTMDRH